MGELIKYILFGIVQGVTEFLPVSSSGHLAILHKYFDLDTGNNLLFDVLLHLGTLLVVLIFYRKIILKMIGSFFVAFLKFLKTWRVSDSFMQDDYARLSFLVLIGSIPTGFVGLYLNDYMEAISSNLLYVAGGLLITSLMLVFFEFRQGTFKKLSMINISDSLIIGFVQGLSVLPGISRSGSTMSMGKMLWINKEEAANFSFILSIPAVGGAFLLKALELNSLEGINIPLFLSGFGASFVSGYLCLTFLIWLIKKVNLKFFAVYCFCLALFIIAKELLL